MKKSKYILLGLALVIGFVLRVYMLGQVPALNADEASIGYNAYSLIQTGKDEHGNPWPIHFQSFNDYKPGLYFYVVLPFVKLFGLSVWSVRLAAILTSMLTIWAVWLLVREIFPNKKLLADLSALLVATSPWHIHFSRGAWEVNFATLLMLLGVLFFLKATKNISNMVFSVLFFAGSLYTYHSARVVVPLLALSLFLVYRKKLLSVDARKIFIGSVIFGALLVVPMMSDFFGPAGVSRAAGVSIFADPGHVSRVNENRGRYSSVASPIAILLHNKPKEYLLAFGKNYFSHFWGEFLFLSGDEIQRNKVPEFGELYMLQVVILVIGVIAIIKRPKNWGAVVLWLVFAPTAAALTFQSPHALRAQNMVIPLEIISAFGLYVIIKWLQKYLKRKYLLNVGYLVLLLVGLWSLGRYIHMYYSHMEKTYPFSSQYGVEELVNYVTPIAGKFDKIYVTNRYDQPYILFLFYQKYPPAKFQGHHELTPRDQYGFSTVAHFDNYYFGPISWDALRDERGSLIIGTDEDIPDEEANIIKKIKFPNGDTAFDIVELK